MKRGKKSKAQFWYRPQEDFVKQIALEDYKNVIKVYVMDRNFGFPGLNY